MPRKYTIKVDRDYLNEIRRAVGLKGAKARAEKLTPERRSEIAHTAREARRSKQKLISHKCPKCQRVIMKLMPKETKANIIYEYCHRHIYLRDRSDYTVANNLVA